MSFAFISTVNAYLKEQYPTSEIVKTINLETVLSDLIGKDEKNWLGGRGVVQPIEVDLPGNVNYVSEGAGVPQPGTGTYVRFLVNGTTIAGTIGLTYQAEEFAPNAGKFAYSDVVDEQMNGMMDRLSLQRDRMFYTGNVVKGLLNERKNSDATTGAGAGNAGKTNWEFTGEWDFIFNHPPTTGDSTTWIPVQFIDLSNALPLSSGQIPGAAYGYNVFSAAHGLVIDGAGTYCATYISGYDAEHQTLELASVDTHAGTYFTTSVVKAGYATALKLVPKSTFAANLGSDDAYNEAILQPNGILENLCDSTLFGVTRSSATTAVQPAANNTRLQSWNMTFSSTGTQARVPLEQSGAAGNTISLISKLAQVIKKRCGTLPDCFLTDPLQVYAYSNALTATSYYIVSDPNSTRRDALPSIRAKQTGDSGFGIGNLPILVSQNCPNGLWIALTRDTHKVITTQSGGDWLPGASGNGPLYQVYDPATGTPVLKFGASWVKIENVYCVNPAANGTLCGEDIISA